MVTYDESMRLAAFVAWIQADGQYKQALQLFKKHPGAQGISWPDRFMKTWARRMSQSKSLKDKQRSGRPCQAEQRHCEQGSPALLGRQHPGWQQGALYRPE